MFVKPHVVFFPGRANGLPSVLWVKSTSTKQQQSATTRGPWMILEMYNFARFIKQIYEVTSRMNFRTTRVKSERRLYEYFAKQTIVQ